MLDDSEVSSWCSDFTSTHRKGVFAYGETALQAPDGTVVVDASTYTVCLFHLRDDSNNFPLTDGRLLLKTSFTYARSGLRALFMFPGHIRRCNDVLL